MTNPGNESTATLSDDSCIATLEDVRWGGIPQCPYCGQRKSTRIRPAGRFRCNNCYTAFSVTVGTVFHHTHLPLRTWFSAIGLLLDSRTTISVRELGRILQVNRNTAWSLRSRIETAMSDSSQRQLLERIALSDLCGTAVRTNSDDPSLGRNSRANDKP